MTCIDLSLGHGSVHDLSYREPSREPMALGSIYASQADRKVVGYESRDREVASSTEVASSKAAASFEGGSKLWRRQQALEVAASSGGGSKLRRR